MDVPGSHSDIYIELWLHTRLLFTLTTGRTAYFNMQVIESGVSAITTHRYIT